MSDDGFIPSISAQSKPDEQPAPQQSSRSSAPGGNGFIPSISSDKDRADAEKPGLMSRADTAITDTLTPNPQNYESLARTNLIEVPKTLGREVYSAGQTIAGFIPSIYHAFADEPTEEEKASQAQFEKEHGEAPGTESTGLKRVGLGIERMTTAPLIEAGRTYANPATRPTLDQALSVAPEAIGQAAGTVVGGKLIGDTAEQIPAAAKMAYEKTAPVVKDIAERGMPAIKSATERASTPRHIGTTIGTIGGAKIGSTLGKPIEGAGVGGYLGGKAAEVFSKNPDEPLISFEDKSSPAKPEAQGVPKMNTKPAAVAPSATETAAPSLSRLEAELNKGLGNEPIKPGVPLREQMTAPEAEPRAPRTQFEAANGKELDTAISKEFPDEKAAKDVRDKIHNLTNVQARELAINLELDLGQDVISRAKQSGGISREEVFKRLLDQGYTADDLSKAINQSKHLSPAQSLINSETGEAKIPFTGKPKATVPKVIDEPGRKIVGTLRQGQKGISTNIPITRGLPGLEGVDRFIDQNVATTDVKRAGSAQSAAMASGKGLATESTGGAVSGRSVSPKVTKLENAAGRLSKALWENNSAGTEETLANVESERQKFEAARKAAGIKSAKDLSFELATFKEVPSRLHLLRDELLRIAIRHNAEADALAKLPKGWEERALQDVWAKPYAAIKSAPGTRAGEGLPVIGERTEPTTQRAGAKPVAPSAFPVERGPSSIVETGKQSEPYKTRSQKLAELREKTLRLKQAAMRKKNQ